MEWTELRDLYFLCSRKPHSILAEMKAGKTVCKFWWKFHCRVSWSPSSAGLVDGLAVPPEQDAVAVLTVPPPGGEANRRAVAPHLSGHAPSAHCVDRWALKIIDIS